MRLRPVILVTAVLALAGCGGERTVSPKPQTVVGSVPTQSAPATSSTTTTSGGGGGGGGAANGKALFASNGCVSCHTYKPAGSKATVGPDLDNLASDAQKAGKPLEDYVRTSITDPNGYVVPGFPKGVMPATYSSLTDQQLADLAAFLTQKS